MAFIEVCNVNNADITILWAVGAHGDGGDFDGPGWELAHAFWPPPLGNPLPGDIHFDDDENWTDQIRLTTGQPIDLVTVAAHEIGHSLGLNHTQVAGSLMVPNYTTSHRYLGYDDVAGIRSLYGLPDQFIDGDNLVCSSCPYSVNIPLPAGTTVSWSTSRPSGLSINSNGVATAVGSFYGEVDVIATLTNTCGFSTKIKKTVWVGRPDVYTIKYDNDIPTSTMNSVTPNVTHTAYLDLANAIKAQISGYVSWNPSPLIGYEYGQFFSKYDFTLQPGQTIYFNPISATNPCGTNMRTLAFTATSGFSYYPNAVVDVLTIEFDNAEYLEALPEQIQLYSESSLTPIRNISLREVYHQNNFKNGNKIEVDMRGLPKGTYFLHVSRKEGKKVNVEKHQLLKR